MKVGVAELPLHCGKTPRWLFENMVKLVTQIIIIIVDELGTDEFLQKIASPFWFQSLGCVLGFDWHSSGLTTTVCGAIKEGLKYIDKEINLFVAGGKGKIARNTPNEIISKSKFMSTNPDNIIYASKMSAKVDSSALQDGYQLYHHTIFWTKDGNWAVVQQGMNPNIRLARRYHWLNAKTFVDEPHTAITAERIEKFVLNTLAKEAKENRIISTELSKAGSDKFIIELKKLQSMKLPYHHNILLKDINPKYLYKILTKTYERQPSDFESLLGIEGVGPKTIRALSLVSDIIYGKSPSFKDPAIYSYAHGGKDGHPYPVDRKNYERTIEILEKAIRLAKIGNNDKLNALRRLQNVLYQN